MKPAPAVIAAWKAAAIAAEEWKKAAEACDHMRKLAESPMATWNTATWVHSADTARDIAHKAKEHTP